MSAVDAELLTRLLALRAAWRSHERWSSARIAAQQMEAFQRLRSYAVARSPFYRERYAGLEEAPLAALPPVTKDELMDRFDEVVTAPSLRLYDIEEHLHRIVEDDADPSVPWRGRWWVAASAGTTGRRGIFIWDHREWAAVLASYTRALSWGGILSRVRRPVRAAMVTTRRPSHQSAIISATFNSLLFPTLRLDASDSPADLAARLGAFQPDLLVGFPSALRPLAMEQLAGRLNIAPTAVLSASEVLGVPESRDIEAAWGVPPVDLYATTETACIASTCTSGSRHVYEDLVIVEPVDADYRPVPPGITGERILVTVLFSRTLPLIRYEMSDCVRLGESGCPCGRSFRILEGVEGRAEDVLRLPAAGGIVAVHPNVFHEVLEEAPVTGWQVVQREDGLDLLVAGAPLGTDLQGLRDAIAQRLTEQGVVGTPVRIFPVHEVPRTPLGKAKLVRGLHP
ncbi:phenylacetate--CoA ligase family protein [Sinomonas terrae]|uniref:Phenylacetate--CoA ligase family protein n=1 Tax=Sinomonas terrae TaxID=2908838 RepID=A0ABS9U3Z7_9MICC|nr:phenylacetate--CoA ligase family protein [Sinomonas terrae]MCH6471315.1 phenylacetate--CoA ligase family protein [Sinomonas terrae]